MIKPAAARRAINNLLKEADRVREMSCDIRETFGECKAFHAEHWRAYGLEEAAEILGHALFKDDLTYRNGNRPQARRGRV